jgi:hypothetical protein
MAKRAKDPVSAPKRAPAKTLEARENQLISLAMDLAEKQLREGTASSQIINTFVNRGSTKERIEKEILAENKELLKAKTDALRAQESVEELYAEAINAMRMYTGSGEEPE